MKIGDLFLRLLADDSGFEQQVVKSGEKAGKKAGQSLGAQLKGAVSPTALLGAAGIGVGIAGITSLIGSATNAAAEYEDSLSAVGVIFGEEMIPKMEEWGDKAHENFGASKQDALAAANVIATLGKSAGLAGDDLVAFSQEMVGLGGDLASMFGGTTQDAITAVSAALRGESEPIRRYGVLLDDATLRQKAFEMGIISTTKNALTPQQKVLAAQASIMEQTTDAQGDFVRTSDGMANSQRALQAQLENVNIEIGQKFLPVMLDLVNFVSDTGIPVMREFIDLLDMGDVDSAAGIPVLDEIEGFLNNVSDAGLTLRDSLTGNKAEVLQVKAALGLSSYVEARKLIQEQMRGTGQDIEQAVDFILNTQSRLTNLGQFVAQNMGGTPVDQAAREMVDGIPEAMEDAKEQAEAVARSTPGSLASQLREGIDDYDAAIDELADTAANSVSDLAERQKIEGILASKELTDALNSDSTRTRLLAMELVNDLVSDYELLAPGALDAGSLVNPNLSAGMRSNLGLASSAANAIRDAAGNPLVNLGDDAYGWGSTMSASFAAGLSSHWQAVRNASWSLGEAAAVPLRLRSPAEIGPLSEPADEWGATLGEMFASGIRHSIPGVQGASLAMAGAAVPGLAVPGFVGQAGSMPTTGGETRIYQLYVDGKPKEVGNTSDALRAFDSMERF